MYQRHFGLKQAPFKNTPDVSMFYSGCDRGAILEGITYAITSGSGITKVVGEVGTGKTFLCHKLAQTLPKSIDIVYIANPRLSPNHILHYIAHELGLPAKTAISKLDIMQSIINYLLKQYANKRQVVILIEEAQCMPLDTLEEIRLLTNIETTRDKLLQIVLFGQPELDRNIAQPAIRQLNERIIYSLYLPHFKQDDVYNYLNFRLQASGYNGSELFDQALAKLITKESKGLVRRVNNIADKMLLAAFSENRRHIKKSDFRYAIKECAFATPSGFRNRLAWNGLG